MDDTMVPLGAAMWLQREMKKFLLFAVEGATHNILLDMSIMRAVFTDIVKEATDVRLETFHAEQQAQQSSLNSTQL
jgi:hypothetical protein